MGEIVKNKAQKTHNLIMVIRQNIHKNFLSLAICLKEVKLKEYYLELGFNSFEEYCMQPEIDLTSNRCNKLIRIYDRWIEDYGYKVKDIEGVDTEKLDIAQSQATEETKEEWLEKAKLLSRADLKALTPGCTHHEQSFEVLCPYCGKTFFFRRRKVGMDYDVDKR